jgi:hypothetical protein
MDLVADLDRFLDEAGEDIILRRKVASVNVDVTIRASVRLANKPDQMMSGATQDDLKVVSSMTLITAAGWPGVAASGTSPFIIDPAIPRRDDFLVIKGKAYRVESCNAIAVRNSVIRIVMMAKGGASGA